nr:hypothetical protein [Tanacetum cinerariifolium]
MAPLTFADTHNMIVFLTKSDASEGFDQIVDFLNAHPIQYALMVNPTTYVLCIKQFWAFISIKKSNDVVKLQDLISRKKVIITEDTIRQALRLDDVDGIDCLPNEEIFAELARLRYEKPSTKLTFYKMISLPITKYTSPTLTQKVFANMKRIGKGFLEVETPLFNAMLVQQQVQADPEVQEAEDDNEVSVVPTLPSPTPATTPPPPQQEPIPSPPQAESAQPSSPPQQQPNRTANISMTLLNQLMETCVTLTKQVANLEQDKFAQALKIVKLKQRVRRLENKRRTKHSGLKRLKKGIAKLDANEDVTLVDVDAEVEVNANIQGMLAESQAKAYHLDLQHDEKVLSMHDTDELEPNEVKEVLEVVTATKLMTEVVTTDTPIKTAAQVPKLSFPRKRRGVVIQDPEEIAVASVIVYSEVKSKEKRKGIIIEEPKPLKRQAQIKQIESFARQLEAELNANINWNDVLEQVKRREQQDNTVMRPIFEKHYNFIRAFLKKDDEEVAVQEKRQSDNLEQDTAKKQRIDEDAEELKTRLQIVVNYDDDVYTEATPLASKDLEALWNLVKERFESTEPKNFSDDFLLNTFKIMFEKPNVEANIWRDQKGRYGLAKLILLVEKKYLLTHFTLEQMLNNVRLEVEEESEMSLELLSFGVDPIEDFKKIC